MTSKMWVRGFVVAVVLSIAGRAVAAAPGEGLVLDPSSGNYVITYCGSDFPTGCVLQRAVFEPATKINPRLKSRFVTNTAGVVVYSYALKNRLTSAQSLDTWVLDPISSIVSSGLIVQSGTGIASTQLPSLLASGQAALVTPSGWNAMQLGSTTGSGIRVGWSFRATLAPGVRQLGFGYSSQDLPGIVAARLTGEPRQSLVFVDEGPDGDISDQFDVLQQADFVSRFAAVPTISVPAPFNRGALLLSIELQVKSWVPLGLLDPVLFTRIDGYLQAAIAAANSGNTPGCGSNVASVRAQIRQIYAVLDDVLDDWTETPELPSMSRLAARVLDFDLNYAINHP